MRHTADRATAACELPVEPAPSADSNGGRNETDLERCDRNLVELLQEVRVVQTGVQVLFGFLLMAPLTALFRQLNTRQHVEYYIAFALTGLAAFLLIAPTAYHRVLFRRGDKDYLVTTANRLTIAGLGVVGVAMTGATMFVTDVLFGGLAGLTAGVAAAVTGVALWAVLPLARLRELSDAPPAQARAGASGRFASAASSSSSENSGSVSFPAR